MGTTLGTRPICKQCQEVCLWLTEAILKLRPPLHSFLLSDTILHGAASRAADVDEMV
ncbi:hypothetical protein NDU88_000360, partial [Pleurodeles waltl]